MSDYDDDEQQGVATRVKVATYSTSISDDRN
jgi:hypothetical protein